MPDFKAEVAAGARDGRLVVGLDEAGRGPWAGPVLAAAVWIDPKDFRRIARWGINDSKRLPSAKREQLFEQLTHTCRFGIGAAEVEEIDAINILEASLLAMRRALSALELSADCSLVDGNQDPRLECETRLLIGGDGRSTSIAAASIIAKVTRDRLMTELASLHPGYGWERNKGYGTAEHRAALLRLGPCAQHRRSFRSVQMRLFA